MNFQQSQNVTLYINAAAKTRLEHFTPRKIAAFAWGRLGDSVCRLPLLRVLKNAFPEAELTAIVEKPNADIFSSAPYIDRLQIIDVDRFRNVRNWQEELAFLKWLRREKFDAVFDPWGRKRSARYALLSGAPLRFGVDLWRKRRLYYNVRAEITSGTRGEAVHLIEHGLILARAAGVECELHYAPIPVGEEDRQAASEEVLNRLVLDSGTVAVLNLGTDGADKRWPVERFCAVAKHLLARGIAVAALRNPDMPELQDELVKEVAQVTALPVLKIKELAAFAEKTHLLISGDTGPLHIWQAMARPVVAIAGVTHPSGFHIDSPYNRTLYHPEICEPALNCNWRGCTRGRPYCTEAVTAQEVVAACDGLLKVISLKVRS